MYSKRGSIYDAHNWVWCKWNTMQQHVDLRVECKSSLYWEFTPRAWLFDPPSNIWQIISLLNIWNNTPMRRFSIPFGYVFTRCIYFQVECPVTLTIPVTLFLTFIIHLSFKRISTTIYDILDHIRTPCWNIIRRYILTKTPTLHIQYTKNR